MGWVYLYALVDRTGQHDISQLRSLQDWFLKYELQTVPGVSEVSALGGMVKQYQVKVNPDKLRAFNIPLSHIQTAIQRGNQEVGASVVEMAEAEYMVRASGYIQGRDDLANIPLGLNVNGPGHSLQFVFQEPVLQAAQLAEIVLTGAIHQCVEVDPTHTGGIRPQLRPGIGRQSGRHLRQVFQYPRTRPVSIGILIKNMRWIWIKASAKGRTSHD